jgi:putative cardiolipin synthase
MSSQLRWLALGLAVSWSWAAIASADVFRLLTADYEAAQARVDLIDQALASIDTSYYGIGNDRIGAMFLSRLEAAARRGVRVRLIVDAEHNGIPAEVQALLIRSGLQIKQYHPVSLRHPLWINDRMHDKTLIVDGEQLIVGSRNMLEAHFGLAEINFVDRDAYLRGQVAQQAQRYFNCLWNSEEVAFTELDDRPWQELKQKDKLDLQKVGVCCVAGPVSACDLARLWLDAGGAVSVYCQPVLSDTGTDWSTSCAREVECVRFVYDPCGEKGHPGAISDQLIDLIDAARCSVVIETPYFLMSHKLKTALADALARGVRVRVLTNSLQSTDHVTVAAGFANQKQCFLLPRGVDVWELAGQNHLHAKSAAIDGSIAFVGSFNFDPRSEFLNTETGVIVHDPAAAAWVEASIRDHMRRSYHRGADGRDTARGERFPGAAPATILKLESLRLVAPLIRRTL